MHFPCGPDFSGSFLHRKSSSMLPEMMDSQVMKGWAVGTGGNLPQRINHTKSCSSESAIKIG